MGITRTAMGKQFTVQPKARLARLLPGPVQSAGMDRIASARIVVGHARIMVGLVSGCRGSFEVQFILGNAQDYSETQGKFSVNSKHIRCG